MTTSTDSDRGRPESSLPANHRGVRPPALLADPPPAKGRLVLCNVRLFDATGPRTRDGLAVVLQDGRVSAIEPASTPGVAPAATPAIEPPRAPAAAPAPEGAVVVDLEGRTLMPGLVNAHVHAIGRVPEPLAGAEPVLGGTHHHFLAMKLRESLRMGITTLRDMGTLGDQVFVARQAMRYGAFRGPRLLTCGAIISASAPGGTLFKTMYREADGCDEVRKAVREQIRRGADFVKVMATGARSVELEAGLVTAAGAASSAMPLQLSMEELRVACDEAGRLGYYVAAHAEGLDGCEAAVELRMRTIEHGMYLHRRPDLLEKMAENEIFLVPTFSSSYWNASRDDQVGIEGEPGANWTAELHDNAHQNIAESERTLEAAMRIGVPVALGGDAWHDKGGAWIEILRMVHHGMPAADALVAATATAARAVGMADLVGTVEVGKLADLVVVDGDPVEHPELLGDPARIWLVLQGGVPVAGTSLEGGKCAGQPPGSVLPVAGTPTHA